MNAYRAGFNNLIFALFAPKRNDYICAYNLITTVYDTSHLHIAVLGTRRRSRAPMVFER